ncbi:hypothetical protein T265_15810, partial [Opisthorchis viverrini]
MNAAHLLVESSAHSILAVCNAKRNFCVFGCRVTQNDDYGEKKCVEVQQILTLYVEGHIINETFACLVAVSNKMTTT